MHVMALTRNFCVAFLIFFGLMAGQAPLEREDQAVGTVSGRVSVADSGVAISGATVSLAAVTGVVPLPGREATYAATTSKEGRFVIRNISPGDYRVFVDSAPWIRGFFNFDGTSQPPGSVISLAAGRSFELKLNVLKPGNMRGKIANSSGEPVPARVTAYFVQYDAQGKSYVPMRTVDNLANGAFTIADIPPGRYVLAADQNELATTLSQSVNPKSQAVLKSMAATTFYPNVASPQSATEIIIEAGSELLGFDFQLKPTDRFSVKGKIRFTVKPASTYMVVLMPNEDYDVAGSRFARSAAVDEEGEFEFPAIPPGSYLLEQSRFYPGRKTNDRIGVYALIEVKDRDVTDVSVVSSEIADLKGTIRTELLDPKQPLTEGLNRWQPAGMPDLSLRTANGILSQPSGTLRKATGLSSVEVRLVKTRGVSFNAPTALTQENGDFQWMAPVPSEYRVEVSNLPSTTFLQAVEWNGVDVLNNDLDLTSGVDGKFTLVLADRPSSVTGKIDAGEIKKPLAGIPVSLWKVTADPGKKYERAYSTTTDADGRFAFVSLAPGEYSVIAWEKLDYGLGQNAKFCRQFSGSAEKIELKRGVPAQASVKMISAKEVEAGKLRMAW
jgi:hypothetical protein